MVYTELPVAAELARAKPDFYMVAAKPKTAKKRLPWNHRDNLTNTDKLLQWLIWNVDPFDVKCRVQYLTNLLRHDKAYEELSGKLNEKGYGVYLTESVMLIWKPGSKMPKQENTNDEKTEEEN